MTDVLYDQDGNPRFVFRDAAPAERVPVGPSRRRRRRRGGRRFYDHYQEPVPAYPWGQPLPHYVPQPAPVAAPAPVQVNEGIDMRTALDAVGTLAPAIGKLVAAFQRQPERPALTGDPQKDMASILDFVADSFDHSRSGAQTASVLATTGALLEILAAL